MSGGLNEWELLEVAEDIEPGDNIVIDQGGEEISLVFVKYEKGLVHLKNPEDGSRWVFRGSSLEEVDGECFIVRKGE